MTNSKSSETIDATFSSFVDDMFDVLSQEDYRKVQRRCLENINVVGGISYSTDVEDKIDNSDNLYDLFKVLCRCRSYWNWMNIRILEKIAGNSSAAKQLIEEYKKKVFSKKVKDVMSLISNLKIPTDGYTEVKQKWNKEFDDLLIEDVIKEWHEIERKLIADEAMLLKSITGGCVEICWLLPNDLVERAISSTTNSQLLMQDVVLATEELFPDLLYLKIGDKVIKDITG